MSGGAGLPAAGVSAGRARAVFFFWASAVGSGDFLGARSATTSLRETSPGFWDRVMSC